MPRVCCAICGAAVRRVPDRDGKAWLYVAVCTETIQAAEPLTGFVGPPIFPRYETTAGSVWATNLLPPVTAGPSSGYYGHGVPAGTGWWAPLVGHVHVPGRSIEAVPKVPECCSSPMRLIPAGWVCRIGEECGSEVPAAA